MKLAHIALLSCLPAFGSAAWTVTNLHPSGATDSRVLASYQGKQGGYATFPGNLRRAGIWSKTAESWVDLNPTGKTDSRILGMYGTQQVGYANSNGGRWSGTAASWTDLSPASTSFSVVTSVSANQQAGYARTTSPNKTCAGYWEGSSGSWVNLGLPWTSSKANGVANGEQVGNYVEGAIMKACRWLGTPASFLSLHPAGGTSSDCLGTDGTRQVGYVNFGGQNDRASLWSGSAASYVDLHPAGAEVSIAVAVSGQNQVGSYRFPEQDDRACYWQGTAASMIDLHAALPANFAVSQATTITFDNGILHIGGYGYNTDTSRYEALLWTQTASTEFTFTLNKAQVAGQNSVQGTITLPQAAGVNTVFTTYDNSSLVNTPPTVTVLAGTAVRNFQITVTAVTSTINTTIYAKRGSIVKSMPLALIPLIPTAISFTPSLVTGGQSTSARVVVNGVAGPGGRVIAIIDNSPNATPPSTVTVPPGASSVTFPIATTPVPSQKTVTVTARVTAGEKSATFRINP